MIKQRIADLEGPTLPYTILPFLRGATWSRQMLAPTMGRTLSYTRPPFLRRRFGCCWQLHILSLFPILSLCCVCFKTFSLLHLIAALVGVGILPLNTALERWRARSILGGARGVQQLPDPERQNFLAMRLAFAMNS